MHIQPSIRVEWIFSFNPVLSHPTRQNVFQKDWYLFILKFFFAIRRRPLPYYLFVLQKYRNIKISNWVVRLPDQQDVSMNVFTSSCNICSRRRKRWWKGWKALALSAHATSVFLPHSISYFWAAWQNLCEIYLPKHWNESLTTTAFAQTLEYICPNTETPKCIGPKTETLKYICPNTEKYLPKWIKGWRVAAVPSYRPRCVHISSSPR